MRRTLFLPVLVLLASGCGVQPGGGAKQVPAGEAYRSFTEDGAWCWFSDPRAIYYEGKYKRTYSGWVDSTGNIVVGWYDHERGTAKTQILHADFERDDHNNPGLFIDADGRLIVFYTKHATGNAPIQLARARNAEDISAWEPLQQLRLNDTIAYEGYSNTYTYTNVFRLRDEEGKMFLFWRGADFKPNFSVSRDNGKSWDEGRILILPERIYRDRRPYIKFASNSRDVIHFAFTDGHPHVEPTNSIYYAKYRDGVVYKANGETIMEWSALPMDPKQADVVYDATVSKEKAWIWDVAENGDGNPVVVYATFPTDTTHVYFYAIYDGGRWNNYRLTTAGPWFPQTPPGAREREPNYSGGIALDHGDPAQVYLSREKNGIFEIEHWTTSDKGKNWTIREVTRNSRQDNVRPFVVRRHPGDALRVLWMNVDKYRHYTDYRSSIRMSIAEERL